MGRALLMMSNSGLTLLWGTSLVRIQPSGELKGYLVLENGRYEKTIRERQINRQTERDRQRETYRERETDRKTERPVIISRF